jgi:DNA primase
MQSSTDIDRVRAVTDEAARIFPERARHLAAASYLRQRGIPATHLASAWRIGYAPPGWTRLVDKLGDRLPNQPLSPNPPVI